MLVKTDYINAEKEVAGLAGFDFAYLSKHKKFRIDRKKLAMVFLLAALLSVIIIFWWLRLVGITITGEAFCNLEEHIHNSDCYASELICNAESVSAAQDEDEQQAHVHSEACRRTTLVCNKPEHTHTADCYPDKTVDTETVGDWLKTLENIDFSSSVPENLLSVAVSQLGYEESQRNFEFDSEGNKMGYTRYGEWYGNPYGNWNTMFVSFCLHYSKTQENETLFSSNAITMHQNWQEAGLFADAENHEAVVGELLFLDTDADETVDHVAILRSVSDDETRMIVGDWNNRVEEIVLDQNVTVIGYGLTYDLPVAEEKLTTQPATQADSTTQGVGSEATDRESEAASDENGHVHTDACYTAENMLICTQWGEEEPWALDWESDEFRDQAVRYVSYLINLIPDAAAFDETLNEYDLNEDYDGYEAYYKEVYDIVSKAFVNYENLLPELKEIVPNRDRLFEYEWLYSGISTMAVTESRTVEFVNYYDNATASKTVLIHSDRVGAYSSFGFYWWYAVVVDENEYGELIVTDKYGYELTNKSNLQPTTERGFVLLSHGDSNAFDCNIGDEVTVDFDYLNTSGKNTDSFGTVTFSDYVPPEIPPTPDIPDTPDEPPVVEDIPVSDINDGELSDVQVKDAGGKTTSAAGDVEISKTIDGTDIENVFDITLTVRTESSMQTYLADPDMAVVIVMDISNTMNNKYPAGSSTSRYDAAVVAAENFINQFAERAKGISKLGFVAFNTHAHEIFDLQQCTTANAAALISEMKSDTGEIIHNYVSDDRTRFTNVEGGLKMGYNMLNTTDNENKYIIFLSDGFPTTYLVNNSSNNTATFYEGYDPYTPSGTKGADGVFYDYVTGYYCSYGTSYSDKASIKARVMADNIKNAGAKIFSIGIDVGGQTIAGYERTGLSVIDRTSDSYEIGDASSTAAYQNWLRNGIGSGYYYDSTNQAEITAAFDTIFAEIESLNKESRETIWTTTDPLPVLGEDAHVVEFVNFFDKDGNPVYDVDATGGFEYIDGEFGVGLENTAFHKDATIYWDLKDSGYETYTSEDGNTTYFFYKIRYRIRLYNENAQFVEYTTYNTNGDAFLEYKTITTTNNETTVSANKIMYFEKPAVEGYYEQFAFFKQSDLGNPIEGAVFTMTHDDEACSVCQGNGQPVTSVSTLGPFTSESDGSVIFRRIPSGHIYTLEETVVPDGYVPSKKIFKVTVALDEISIRIYESEDDEQGTLWTGDNDFIFVNQAFVYILPETGGSGTLHFAVLGCVLMAIPVLFCAVRSRQKRRFCRSDKT